MANQVLDTNKPAQQLRKLRHDSTPEDARRLADELIETYETNAIVSPIEIEVLSGVRDAHDLTLTESFLERFQIIDQRPIPPEDWEEAKRIAKRVLRYDREVPRSRQKRGREKHPKTEARDFGDSLILAIARRLHYDVISDDLGLHRQHGRTRRERP